MDEQTVGARRTNRVTATNGANVAENLDRTGSTVHVLSDRCVFVRIVFSFERANYVCVQYN